MIRLPSSRTLICAALTAFALLVPRVATAHVGTAIGVDAQGRIYFVDTYRNVLWRIDRDGHRTALLRGIHTNLIAVMPDGTVYLPVDDFHDDFRWKVTIVNPAGSARDTTIATGIAVNGGHTVGADAGGIYFQRGTELSQVSYTGTVRAWLYALPRTMDLSAAAPTVFQRLAVLNGNTIRLSEADTVGPGVIGDSAAGFADMSRTSARFDHPIALAVDTINGTMYLADYGNRRVRRVTFNGDATTLAHPSWPWRPTGVALRSDTLYVLERATPYWGFMPIPNFLADMLGTPRVTRVLPNGRVELVVWMVSWWTWGTSTILVAAVLTWWIARTRGVKREARGVAPIQGT